MRFERITVLADGLGANLLLRQVYRNDLNSIVAVARALGFRRSQNSERRSNRLAGTSAQATDDLDGEAVALHFRRGRGCWI